jgi:hypothetical protein
MTVELLEEALRRPKPFAIFLTDGRRIDVPHPEFAWLMPPNKTSLFVSKGKQGGVEWIRVNQIVSLQSPDDEAA